jgi:hypothetical protein
MARCFGGTGCNSSPVDPQTLVCICTPSVHSVTMVNGVRCCGCGRRGDADWQTANSVPAGAAVSVGLLGQPSGGSLTNVVDNKVSLCKTLASVGIDSRFWWLN